MMNNGKKNVKEVPPTVYGGVPDMHTYQPTHPLMKESVGRGSKVSMEFENVRSHNKHSLIGNDVMYFTVSRGLV